jgi:hypothetical protein
MRISTSIPDSGRKQLHDHVPKPRLGRNSQLPIVVDVRYDPMKSMNIAKNLKTHFK